MKKTLLLVALATLFTGAVSAQSSEAVWDSEYDRWDLSVGVGGGLVSEWTLAAYPSVELIVYSIKIDDYLPLDFGVSVRSLISRYSDRSSALERGWDHVGIGLAGTVHLSFNNLEGHSLPFMENFDFYLALGPLYDVIEFTGAYAPSPPSIPASGIGFTFGGGAKYFILDWLAAHLELFVWSYTAGIQAGLTFNF